MPKDDFHNGWIDREDRGVQERPTIAERRAAKLSRAIENLESKPVLGQFKVGDRVEHIDNAPGYVGTVKDVANQVVFVEWDKRKGPFEMHEPRFLKISAAPTEAEADPVNSPAHYTAYPHEVIDFTEHMNFNRGNAVKYIARAGLKNPDTEVEDLEKAAWYIARELKRIGGAK